MSKPKPFSKPFDDFLHELDQGAVHDKLTDRLAEVVAAVIEHADKGELLLKLKIEINKAGRLEFSTEVKAKKPGAPIEPTQYTIGPDGQWELFDGPPPDGKAKAAGMHLN